ncbi:MAG: zf-TFIIB domain-containing protein [Candidatus Binatia bacterium]
MATNEKDRLGDKLRDAERAREDAYFAERDRELVAKLRRVKESDTEAVLKQAARMRCPKCGEHLHQRSLNGVEVEECAACRGMWLDQGELEKIGQREADGWIARWLRTEFPKTT